MSGSITTGIRNAGLSDVLEILTEQRARRLDVVVRQRMIGAYGGNLTVAAGDSTQWVSDEGVTSAAGVYRPTAPGDEGLAGMLGIPHGYLKNLRALGRTDLWDANVGGFLHGGSEDIDGETRNYPPYDGALLLRLLRGDESTEGVLRAVLSPRYKIIDNLDVLLAVMDGLRQAGVEAVPDVSDLTDRRMHVRFSVPGIAAFAPQLLAGYRSPFEGPGGVRRAGQGDRPGMQLRAGHFGIGGEALQRALAAAKREGRDYPPGQEPVVFAGIKVTNSDTGEGARSIAPEIVVQICGNRLTLTASADRAVHLGSLKDEGVIQWSAETCQPPGTQVLTVAEPYDRSNSTPVRAALRYVPIESVRAGDQVVSYGRGSLHRAGNRVTAISSRPFSGRLVTVQSQDGRVSRYTPEHRCVAIPGPAVGGKYALYLMQRGESFRVGVTSSHRPGAITGIGARLAEEQAENAWVLSVHETRDEAQVAEAYASWRFGIPVMRFRIRPRSGHAVRTQQVTDGFWQKLGDLTPAARECLSAYGRELAYPLVVRDKQIFTLTRAMEIRACNLLSGMQLYDGDALAAGPLQTPVRTALASVTVNSEFYEGPVWSMDVEKDHTYVADGFVTHNCEHELKLITSQAADAVKTFLTPEWFLGKVAEIEALAGVPVSKHEEVIKDVSRTAGFSQGEADAILAHFLRGGSYTSGGVANAVTSVSQTLPSADRAAELDAKAMDVMAHAARLAG